MSVVKVQESRGSAIRSGRVDDAGWGPQSGRR